MSFNRDKAFEADHGFTPMVPNSEILGPFLTGSPDSPLGLYNLPEDTFYVQNDGTKTVIWQKFGPTINDWQIYPAADISFNPAGVPGITDTNVQDAIASLAGSSTASPGWYDVGAGIQVSAEDNRIAREGKFVRQSGYIKHSGFVKGDA